VGATGLAITVRLLRRTRQALAATLVVLGEFAVYVGLSTTFDRRQPFTKESGKLLNKQSGYCRMGALAVAALVLTLAGFSLSMSIVVPTNAQAASCKVILKGDADLWAQGSNAEAEGGEAGLDNAYGEWADCLNAQTDASMAGKAKLKERMRRLFNDEGNFVDASFGLASQQAGGGTMFAHQASRSRAPLAEHRARLVALLLVPAGGKTSLSIKARYDKAVKVVNAYVARIKKPTAIDLELTTKEDWNAEMATAVKAWTQILPVAGTKKDAAGLEIVEFMASYAVI
jgi:hypothetical protein